MKIARYKYKILLRQGKWEVLDTQQAHIIALQTEINILKTKSKDGTKNPHTSKGKNRVNGKSNSTNQGKQRAKRD